MLVCQQSETVAYATVFLCSMERARGIEPPSLAWEADVLPMNYARKL